MFVLPDSVLRILPNRALIGAGSSASFGASSGGTLKLAKIVMLSLAANRRYDNRGIRDAGELVLPNILANWLSLYTQAVRLTAEVAANLVLPDVTVVAGRDRTVAVRVSIVFAVK